MREIILTKGMLLSILIATILIAIDDAERRLISTFTMVPSLPTYWICEINE